MGFVEHLQELKMNDIYLLEVLDKLESQVSLLVNTENPKVVELESHFLRLLDALVELEERITSLEKSRALSSEFNTREIDTCHLK